MKIALLINTSGAQIFQNNTKVLIEEYKKVINKHNLDIDVITVTGKLEGRTEYFEDIVVDCDEKYLYKVCLDALETLIDKYDIIVKVNTNTVINLQLLQLYCNSGFFSVDSIYSTRWIILLDGTKFSSYEQQTEYYKQINKVPEGFPSGEFVMAHSNMWKKLLSGLNDVDRCNELCNKYFNPCTDEFRSYSDDIMYGILCVITNIEYGVALPKSYMSPYKSKLDGSSFVINENSLITNCKLEVASLNPQRPYTGITEFREFYEYKTIQLICKVYELYTPTYKDIKQINDDSFYVIIS